MMRDRNAMVLPDKLHRMDHLNDLGMIDILVDVLRRIYNGPRRARWAV